MKGAQSRILITGTFCSLNKGDAAMRIALTDALHKAIPGCHVTVTTPYPELDGSAYRSEETIRCSRRKVRRAAAMIARALCWNVVRRLSRKDVSGVLDEELKAYRGSDVVVDLSGDGLTEEYGLKCLFSHMVPIVLARLLARPVFVCAQTIGPLYKSCPISRTILSKVDAISARESLTYDYLRSLGLGPLLSLSADLAFLMEPEAEDRAREILAVEKVPRDRPLIGLSVSRLPGHVRGAEESGKPVDLEREMAGALDKIVEMGLRPVFISHTTGPGERRDDRLTATRVANIAQRHSGISVLAGDHSAEETKGIIGLTDLFMGVRMHSCIAAMSMGVPTVSIAYGPKAFGIMALAGQERWVLDIRRVTTDRLFGMFEEAWSSRDEMRTSLQLHMPQVFAMANDNVEIIKRMLTDVAGKERSSADCTVNGR